MKGICGNVTNFKIVKTMRLSTICILFVIVNIATYATYSVFKKAVDLKFAVYSEYYAQGSRHDLLPLRIF